MPFVSVIIPAYNQGDYLSAAVQSVLDQTYEDFEILIIDDGSTDNTQEVACGFTDSRIQYLYQENRGLSGARNTGLRQATGSLITFLDSDDLFLPDKLKILVGVLEEEPDTCVAAGQAVLIDENGKEIEKRLDLKLPDDSAQLLLNNPLHVGSVLVRRSCLSKAGYFDENLSAYEDWDMWLRFAKMDCRIVCVEQPVSMYRFHRDQMTRDPERMRTASFAVLNKVFNDPGIPASWLEIRDQAYARAHLRAAAQAYRAGLMEKAKADLIKAAALNPELRINDAKLLDEQITAWTDDARTNDPIRYLESVYTNLPEDFANLRQHRRRALGRAAMRIAFEAYRNGDFIKTRSAILHAIRYQPIWLRNRGTISIFLRSSLKILRNRS